ncbi:MAG: hypothetical protein AAF203_01730 [Pseudomonadota bacterium]
MKKIIFSTLIIGALATLLSMSACSNDNSPQEGQVTFKHVIDPVTAAAQKAAPGVKLDAQQKRALYVENETVLNLPTLTVRNKIIALRAIGLYLEDILPEIANVYGYAFQHLNARTQSGYQDVVDGSSEYLDQVGYLPKANLETLVDDKDVAKTFEYVGRWLSHLEIMRGVDELYKKSILVESAQDSLEPSVFKKYDRAVTLLRTLRLGFEKDMQAMEATLNAFNDDYTFKVQKRKATVQLIADKMQGMLPFLPLVENDKNTAAIKLFVERSNEIVKVLDLSDRGIADYKRKVGAMIRNEFRIVNDALSKVDLPDGSTDLGAEINNSINSSQEQFDAVMKLQIGFMVVKYSIDEIQKW